MKGMRYSSQYTQLVEPWNEIYDYVQSTKNGRLLPLPGHMSTPSSLSLTTPVWPGNLFAPEHYHACLSRIMADSRPPPEVPVSALTAAPRDEWARAREDVLAAGNADSLRSIDSALFVLALDSETFQGTEQEKVAHHFLHGPVHNRWVGCLRAQVSQARLLSRSAAVALV